MGDSSAAQAACVCQGTVLLNRPLCNEHFRLTVVCPAFPGASPGQFVQVRCGSLDGRHPVFLRRPFSIAGMRSTRGGAELDLLYRVVGPATEWMAALQPDAEVSIIGPLGRPFAILPSMDLSIIVGGGVGLPPVMWLARAFRGAGLRAIAVAGARSRCLLPMTLSGGGFALGDGAVPVAGAAEFGDVPVVITTDDGSCGIRGSALDGLTAVLGAMTKPGDRLAVYACGPEPMLRAIGEHAQRHEIPCQLSLERMMACGMGTCQSCVVRVKDGSHKDGWRYRLCCTDGPVFHADDLAW